jgi:uncharacterized protein involved in exopolysaccharide biosynthesis
VEITATAGDPDLAARIANLWAESYVSHVNRLYGRPRESYESVQRQLLAAEETYQEAEAELQAYLLESPLELLRLRLQDTEHQIEKQMQDRQLTLAKLHSTRRRMETLLGDAAALHDQVQSSGIEGASTTSLSILMLKAEVFSGSDELPLEVQLQVEAASDPGEADAQETDLRVLRRVIETRILALNTMIEEALSAPLPEGVEDLHEELRQLRSGIEQESALKRELTGRRDLAWETCSTLQTKSAELGIATEMGDVQVVLASPAVRALKPMGLSIWVSALLAAILGCALCVLAVFSFQYLVEETQADPQ